MAKQKSKLELQSSERLRARAITTVGDTIRTIVRAAAVLGVFYFGFDAIKAFVGKTSFADLHLVAEMIGKIGADRWVAYVLAAVFGTYGLAERRLRQHKTQYLTERISHLESELDPKRSSSGLQKTGETRIGD